MQKITLSSRRSKGHLGSGLLKLHEERFLKMHFLCGVLFLNSICIFCFLVFSSPIKKPTGKMSEKNSTHATLCKQNASDPKASQKRFVFSAFYISLYAMFGLSVFGHKKRKGKKILTPMKSFFFLSESAICENSLILPLNKYIHKCFSTFHYNT